MAAHPKAMSPSTPGSTRTAPPQTAKGWYSQPRMRTYLLFDATGLVYLLVGTVVLRLVWALGSGQQQYEALLTQFSHPLYIAFHALTLAAVVFVAVRFFRLFPKAQPPRLGPAKPPPGPVIAAMLYAGWLGATVVLGTILAGVIF